jgi:hypothetical protein
MGKLVKGKFSFSKMVKKKLEINGIFTIICGILETGWGACNNIRLYLPIKIHNIKR